MHGRALSGVVRQLIVRYGHPTLGAVSDAELLRQFVKDRNDESFGELHRRHGPLVWAACRSMLNASADAEDAYQATFLTLVRSARQVRNAAAVGAWLHGVAVKVSLKARQRTASRIAREVRAARAEAERPVADGAWERLLAAVHLEVEKFPASLREVFVLCDLQGVAQADAAKRLGCTVGSLSSKLAKARAMLAKKLEAQGVVPSVAAAAVGVVGTNSEAGVVPATLASTVRTFVTTPGGASAAVQSLAGGVATMTKLKWAFGATLSVSVVMLGLGTGWMPSATGQFPGQEGRGQPPFGSTQAKAYSIPLPSYKYVLEGQSSDSLGTMAARLEKQKADGLEFCGAVELRLTKGEVNALRADKLPPEEDAAADRQPHRVLVFKRAAPAKADGFNPFNQPTNTAPKPMPASGPLNNRVVMKNALAREVAATLQNMFGSDRITFAYDDAANSIHFSSDDRDVKLVKAAVAEIDRLSAAPKPPKVGLGFPPANSATERPTVPQTVVYSVTAVSLETMEKVATGLANSAGSPAVTVVADAKSSSLILAGDGKAIETIIDRLEAIKAKLNSSKPNHGM